MYGPGSRVKELRLACGLTQQQLAMLAEIDSTMITKIERGYTSGSLHTLEKVATALGVNITELFCPHQKGD